MECRHCWKTCFLIFVSCLAGCGGGGGDDPEEPEYPYLPPKPLLSSAYGLWEGTATDSSNFQYSARLFAYDSQTMHLYITPTAALATQGNGFTFAGPWLLASTETVERCCLFDGHAEAVSVVDRFDSGANLPTVATFSATYSGGLAGSLTRGSVRYDLRMNRDMSEPVLLGNSTLAGTYSGTYSTLPSSTAAPPTWTLTIEANGRITGSDGFGCAWIGTSTFNGINANLFKFALEASGCSSTALAPVNGTYTALGRYFAPSPTHARYPGQGVIQLSLRGPVWLGIQELAR